MSRASKNTEEMEPLYMAGGDAKCYSHPREQFDNFL